MAGVDSPDWNQSEDFFKKMKITDCLINLNILKGDLYN
jgi:hypothetical protein